MIDGSFDERTALVTGAGRGTGSGTALLLARDEAAGAVNDHDGAEATGKAELIRAKGGPPLGRFGTPQDAAGAIWLLCRPELNLVSGQVLGVNGGLVY